MDPPLRLFGYNLKWVELVSGRIFLSYAVSSHSSKNDGRSEPTEADPFFWTAVNGADGPGPRLDDGGGPVEAAQRRVRGKRRRPGCGASSAGHRRERRRGLGAEMRRERRRDLAGAGGEERCGAPGRASRRRAWRSREALLGAEGPGARSIFCGRRGGRSILMRKKNGSRE